MRAKSAIVVRGMMIKKYLLMETAVFSHGSRERRKSGTFCAV
jgi:hypothetical protein